MRRRTVKVGGGGEAFPDGSGEMPGIGSIGTGSDRVMYGVIGDRRQPAVAAVDDAALLVADEAGRRFPRAGLRVAAGPRGARGSNASISTLSVSSPPGSTRGSASNGTSSGLSSTQGYG